MKKLLLLLPLIIAVACSVSANAQDNARVYNDLVGTRWYPSEGGLIFDHTSFINGVFQQGVRTRPREFKVKGIICPSAIDKYNILCLQMSAYSSDNGNFIFLPNKKICDWWRMELGSMKALFLQNDQIAKENNVIADVKKDVSWMFMFEGFLGTFRQPYESIIVQEYNETYKRQYGYDKEYQNKIGVFYLYQNGQSSMELRIADYFSRRYSTIWTFNSVEDFDAFINALDWSSFMQSCNEAAQKIKQEHELEARKQREQSLFD